MDKWLPHLSKDNLERTGRIRQDDYPNYDDDVKIQDWLQYRCPCSRYVYFPHLLLLHLVWQHANSPTRWHCGLKHSSPIFEFGAFCRVVAQSADWLKRWLTQSNSTVYLDRPCDAISNRISNISRNNFWGAITHNMSRIAMVQLWETFTIPLGMFQPILNEQARLHTQVLSVHLS